jgi:hypothetical protein
MAVKAESLPGFQGVFYFMVWRHAEKMHDGAKASQIAVKQVIISFLKPGVLHRRLDNIVNISARLPFKVINVNLRTIPVGIHHNNIADKPILVLFVADMKTGWIRAFEKDVVLDQTEIPFPQFDADANAEVLHHMIIGRAVIQIDPPAAGIPETVMPDDRRILRILFDIASRVRRLAVRLLFAPAPLAAPGIKRPMIAGLAHGVVDIVMFDDVSAVKPVIQTDCGARWVMDVIMTGWCCGWLTTETRPPFASETRRCHGCDCYG